MRKITLPIASVVACLALEVAAQDIRTDGGVYAVGTVEGGLLASRATAGYSAWGFAGNWYITAAGAFAGAPSVFGFVQVGNGRLINQLQGPLQVLGNQPTSPTDAVVVLGNSVVANRPPEASVVRVTDGHGQSAIDITESGGIRAGSAAGAYTATFSDRSRMLGHPVVDVDPPNVPVIYGHIPTPDQAIIDGPHGLGLVVANFWQEPDGGLHGQNGGWIFEADNFTCGAASCSKKFFVDHAGGWGQYCPTDTPGLKRADFGTCPEVWTPTDAGLRTTGHFEGTFLYACDEHKQYQCAGVGDGGLGWVLK